MEERILVVDDEIDICNILLFNLEKEGYAVDIALSGEEALAKLSDQHRLIILDVMMSGISGFQMAEMLRKEGNNLPIIFLTAKNRESDLLTGFSRGGDDYISKPFSVKELLARVKALLRRTAQTAMPASSKLMFGGLSVDLSTRIVKADDRELSLTRKEFDILVLLAQASPNLLTRIEILQSVWSDNEFVLERTVDVHITRLRKKLGDYGNLIVNRSGFGYYMINETKQ